MLSEPSANSPFSQATNPPKMLRQALPEPCLQKIEDDKHERRHNQCCLGSSLSIPIQRFSSNPIQTFLNQQSTFNNNYYLKKRNI